MSNRKNDSELPRYNGPRDSVTGEVLPPVGYERETGIPASEFDSEVWLVENGYRPEKSKRKGLAEKQREDANKAVRASLERQ